MPPLRERREDIPLLVQYFLSKFSQRMKKNIEIVPPEGMQALCRYSWPGNIRELEHVIERAVILSSGPVLKIPAFEPVPAEAALPSTSSALEDVEREHIIRVLREAKGKIGGPGGAAERLGMNRTTLNSRMQKLKIQRQTSSDPGWLGTGWDESPQSVISITASSHPLLRSCICQQRRQLVPSNAGGTVHRWSRRRLPQESEEITMATLRCSTAS